MLYIFDLDGTLISSYMDNPLRDYALWKVLPGRRERLHALLAVGHRIAIATNQAGVAFGHVDEQQVEDKLAAVLKLLELPADVPVAISYAHPNARSRHYRDPVQVARRKPSGTMLRELMVREPEAAALGVFYVGDRAEDEAAARDAHVGFVHADTFFSTPQQSG